MFSHSLTDAHILPFVAWKTPVSTTLVLAKISALEVAILSSTRFLNYLFEQRVQRSAHFKKFDDSNKEVEKCKCKLSIDYRHLKSQNQHLYNQGAGRDT